MKNRVYVIVRLLSLLLVSFLLLCVSVLAAAVPGSADDPLVTLSYLRETFLTEMLTSVDARLAERDAALAEKLTAQIAADKQFLAEKYGEAEQSEGAASGTADTFLVVTMSKGQILCGEVGCEVMLRVGTANAVAPSSPGLIDSTAATTLDSGKALIKNHLYMMTIEDRGVKATAQTTKLLVRGTYAVK